VASSRAPTDEIRGTGISGTEGFKQGDLLAIAAGSTRIIGSMPCWGLIIHENNRTVQWILCYKSAVPNTSICENMKTHLVTFHP